MLKKSLVIGFLAFVFLWAIYIISWFFSFSSSIPNYDAIKSYNPSSINRMYSYDGQVVNSKSLENRVFVPIEEVPEFVKNAFISAEDESFYTNSGVDVLAIIKAIFIDTYVILTGKGNLIGASTITQQVVKNVILNRDRNISRKIKEILISLKITRILTKDQILEIYLNHIFLGNNSYGVMAASLNYFNKNVKDLTVSEAAVLASLPKAPSALDPRKGNEKIAARRNWVIDRMLETSSITKEQAEIAKSEKIKIDLSNLQRITLRANGFSNMVESVAEKHIGRGEFENGGYFVQTTLKSKVQNAIYSAFKQELEQYDKRHGYRGHIGKIKAPQSWCQGLESFEDVNDGESDFYVASVISNENEIKIGIKGSCVVSDLNKTSLDWLSDRHSKLSVGDVILVRKSPTGKGYDISQVPLINGSVTAIDPRDGRVLGLVGGYFENKGDFNRAIQAYRQTGSATKPFIYLTAIENGFNPANTIVDAKIELAGAKENEVWSPKNSTNKYYGATTLRYALEKSLNVPTVRLSEMVGVSKIASTFQRFRVYKQAPDNLSSVLGSSESTSFALAYSFAAIANGGYYVDPVMVEYIQDRNGGTVYKRDDVCKCESKESCEQVCNGKVFVKQRIVDEATNYQMISLLEGVIKRGTGSKAAILGLPLGGKTGTTNDSKDSWFVGFTPEIVIVVHVGYDIPQTLGSHEYGATIALPIFISAMSSIYDGVDRSSIRPFKIPSSGIKIVKVDYRTGKIIHSPDQGRMINEVLKISDKASKGGIDDSELFGIGGIDSESEMLDDEPAKKTDTLKDHNYTEYTENYEGTDEVYTDEQQD